MLKFTYYGEDKINPLPACELVDFTRRYKLPSLLRICEDKIRTSVAMDTVLPILAIAYMPAEGKQDLIAELKSKCFPFILENLSKVDLTLLKASNPLLVIDLLFEIQNAWKSGSYGIGKLPANFSSGISGDKKSSSRKNKPSSSAPDPPSRKAHVTPSKNSGRRDNTQGSLLGAQRKRGPQPPVPEQNIDKPPPSKAAPPPPSRNAPPPSLSAADNSSSDESKPKKPLTKKDKKEEERRKKEEAKRIQREKKERLKMEKKFKPKGKEIF